MTAIDYIEEIKLRLSRFDVIKHLNDLLILSYINKGRQQAQRFTLESMPERYARISTFAIGTAAVYTTTDYRGKPVNLFPVALPNDFLKAYRVILNYTLNNVPKSWEARYYTVNEIYNTNVLSVNPPMPYAPVYTVTANNDTNYNILISGLDIPPNSTIFATLGYTNISCEVWYTAAISEIEYRTAGNTTDNEVTLPVPLEELVINYAMYHCLRHVNHQAGIELLIKEIRLLESLITQNYEIGIQTKDIELATY